MQQSSYRSALQATPSRHKFGVSGINSRVQDTAWLLSHVAQPAGRSALRPRHPRHGVRGVNSRVQDTAWLLSHVAQPAGRSALPPVVQAGVSGVANAAISRGLGFIGADWLTQGLVLAMGAEFVNRMMTTDPGVDSLKREAEIQDLAQRAANSDYKGVVGYDRFITVMPSHLDRFDAHTGLGRLGGFNGLRGQELISLPATIATSAITSGSSMAASSTWLAAAGGPIGLAVAGVTVALTLLFNRKGPKQKVATTTIVNDVEPTLQANLDGYFSGPRTVSSQQQAVANFDAGWKYVTDNCGQAQMGTPGKWCVDDRKPGGKWDWFARYRDPIANDVPNPDPGFVLEEDPTTGQVIYRQKTGQEVAADMNLAPLLLAGVLGVLAFSL